MVCGEEVVRALRLARQEGHPHRGGATNLELRESLAGPLYARVGQHVAVVDNRDFPPLDWDVEYVRDGFAVRHPVPDPQDPNHQDLFAGGPRRGDDGERLLDALDEDEGNASVAYQVALARVDVEDVARPTELLAGGFVLEAGLIGIRIVGPECPRPLTVRAGDLVENSGRTLPLAFAEAAGELATVRDRVDPAPVQDVGRDRGTHLVRVAV